MDRRMTPTDIWAERDNAITASERRRERRERFWQAPVITAATPNRYSQPSLPLPMTDAERRQFIGEIRERI